MTQARMMGNYAQHLAEEKGISLSQLSKALECDEITIQRFFKGHILLPFAQISKLAETLSISIEQLLTGDKEQYEATVVHCQVPFNNPDNRETILDIIDDYVAISNIVNS